VELRPTQAKLVYGTRFASRSASLAWSLPLALIQYPINIESTFKIFLRKNQFLYVLSTASTKGSPHHYIQVIHLQTHLHHLQCRIRSRKWQMTQD
jgi:hypothetical protein